MPQRCVVRKDQAVGPAFEAQRDRGRATLGQVNSPSSGKARCWPAKPNFESAEAALEGAKADVALYDATVVAVVTKQGRTVISSQIAPVIVKLANLSTMMVKAKISDAAIIRVF